MVLGHQKLEEFKDFPISYERSEFTKLRTPLDIAKIKENMMNKHKKMNKEINVEYTLLSNGVLNAVAKFPSLQMSSEI